MESTPTNNPRPKRRLKWIIIGCIIVVVALTVFLLTDTKSATKPHPPRFDMTNVGYDKVYAHVLVSNKTDEPLFFVSLQAQVHNEMVWVGWGTPKYNVRLAPHESTYATLSFAGLGTPTKPWRVAAEALEPIHGMASLRARLRQAWFGARNHSYFYFTNSFDSKVYFFGNDTVNNSATINPTNSPVK